MVIAKGVRCNNSNRYSPRLATTGYIAVRRTISRNENTSAKKARLRFTREKKKRESLIAKVLRLKCARSSMRNPACTSFSGFLFGVLYCCVITSQCKNTTTLLTCTRLSMTGTRCCWYAPRRPPPPLSDCPTGRPATYPYCQTAPWKPRRTLTASSRADPTGARGASGLLKAYNASARYATALEWYSYEHTKSLVFSFGEGSG